MSHHTQANFASGILDRRQPVPSQLAAWTGVPPVKRFDVYRNNVTGSLVNALAIRFPVTERIVGRDFFEAMARCYVERQPPHTPVLLDYGDDFHIFAAGFEPARSLAYLPDVIRLENARMRAYHAADARPLDSAGLAVTSGEDAAALLFAFHPSFAVLRSNHPVLTIWGMNEGVLPLGSIEPWQGEDVLVVRPGLQILMHRLPAGGAVFLESLAAGAALGGAAEQAFAAAEDFDLTANLGGLMSSGAVTGLGAATV